MNDELNAGGNLPTGGGALKETQGSPLQGYKPLFDTNNPRPTQGPGEVEFVPLEGPDVVAQDGTQGPVQDWKPLFDEGNPQPVQGPGEVEFVPLKDSLGGPDTTGDYARALKEVQEYFDNLLKITGLTKETFGLSVELNKIAGELDKAGCVLVNTATGAKIKLGDFLNGHQLIHESSLKDMRSTGSDGQESLGDVKAVRSGLNDTTNDDGEIQQ